MSGNAFTSATSLGASSIQDYGTPPEFLAAVETGWGSIAFDLAAHEGNHVCSRWFGPGGEAEDSLQQAWHEIPGLLWLNPPFSASKRWAKKCAEEAMQGANIALLAPANVGADWFWSYVSPHAHVLCLKPRICFVGAPWRAWHKGLPKGSIAVPAELQSESEIRTWLANVYGSTVALKARVARLPFPGALMLALYGLGCAGQLARWEWAKK